MTYFPKLNFCQCRSVSAVASALAFHSGGHEFEPQPGHSLRDSLTLTLYVQSHSSRARCTGMQKNCQSYLQRGR